MNIVKQTLFGALIVPLAFVGPANAAFLENVQGVVLVDRGSGFKPALGSLAVKPGDRVMAKNNASAVINYSGDCKAIVKAGAVVSVVKDSACIKSKYSQTGGAGGTSSAGGAGAAGLAADAAVIGVVGIGAGGLLYQSTRNANRSSP